MTQILVSMDLNAPCTEISSKGELRKIRWKVWRSLLKKRPILHILNNCRIKSQMHQLLSPEEANILTSNLFCHQTSITMTILAITLQKVISLALISYWAAKSYEETLVFPGMYTFMFCFLQQIAWELGGIPASFSPRVPNLFSLFTSPAPQLDWDTVAKDVGRKLIFST